MFKYAKFVIYDAVKQKLARKNWFIMAYINEAGAKIDCFNLNGRRAECGLRYIVMPLEKYQQIS